MKEFKEFLRFYRQVNKEVRTLMIHTKWRFFIAIISTLFVIIVYYYVKNKFSSYFCGIVKNGVKLGCDSSIFYWFMMGLVSGIIIAIILFEGEIFLSLRKYYKQHKKRKK